MKKIMFNDRFGLTQAVLDGRKTQTRRVVPQSVIDKYAMMEDPTLIDDARYDVGEVVAVAQSYRDCGGFCKNGIPRWNEIAISVGAVSAGWDNKMFVRADLMPHHIRITDVRVEHLQDTSDEDCLKEGLEWDGVASQYYVNYQKETGRKMFLGKTLREAFACLIDKVSGKGTWERNPYVFVYDFELVKP
ncbi:hypothetical protein QVO32_03105 [Bacteroides gallinaceum]|uniref:hypothetical protein n=1 Tax=Bacteroides gallinaceum TaxID=1462571 RepID=UPI0025AB2748|nr:hypothetical protein [Bacteroides gallinaceum]MDN0078400.1 hypothetical protein [Bacteroides gallinaceum]